MKQVRTYSPNVRVGNWLEDIVLKEDMLKEFLEQKDRGELTLQRIGTLRDNILKPVELSVARGSVRFGDTVMLLNAVASGPGPDSHQDLHCLSIIADIKPQTRPQPDNNQSLPAPCYVSAAKSLQPCVRNAFTIDSVDGTVKGEELRYGQSFYLRTTAGYAGELYLASDAKSFQKCARKSRLQEVSLVEEPSFLCHWTVKLLDPKRRQEQCGTPVPANTKVLISHCKTNQCLALLSNHVLWTPYGKEYEVTAHTLLDSHKAEQPGNHWLMATADPGNPGDTLVQSQQSANGDTEEDCGAKPAPENI
ncbi:cilia- and flagella-associated protein 161 [Engraulis encrasicolus]|uniref:cilia- and flagella-associated protein 161 n=1 Tax=Engraulis encrasicolus TaxID=184585 RepID=UPI002FD5B89B